ncbi:hypothetical protein BGX28_005528 [Mortierella sp. GBA30]|nr:hypothetical protein BGX28_005528 [Mortierella sp. GBA30]
MKSTKRIDKGVDNDAIRDMSSDLFADIIYSFATDLLKELYADGNIQDVDRAIATVNTVTKSIALNGVKLRKANIERRTKAKKESVIDDSGVVEKEDVKWKKYRKDKKLEYTMDICINGKHPLKKRKEDVVVGLLTEEQLSDDYEDNGKYKMSSKEKEQMFTMGFVPDVEYKRK